MSRWKNDSTSTIVVMHRFDIVAPYPPHDLYLRRWYLFRCPLFGVMLHKIVRPDQDRDLHDHPWAFCSMVLRGGYNEEVPTTRPDVQQPTFIRGVTRTNHKPHGALHRIDKLHRTPTWTLVFTGPKRGSWGFMVDGEMVPWREYIASGGRPAEISVP